MRRGVPVHPQVRAVRTRHVYLEPAASIVAKLGGPHNAADNVLKVNRSIVFRFMYPKSVRGRGGWIPREYHKAILEYAAKHNIDIAPGDFYQTPELKQAG